MLQTNNSDLFIYSKIFNVSLVTLMFHFDYKCAGCQRILAQNLLEYR